MKNFQEIIARAKLKGPIAVAVVRPHDIATVLAVKEGIKTNLIRAELFGDRTLMAPLLEKAGLSEKDVELFHSADGALVQAIASVREGRSRMLMKGNIHTPELLRAALSKTAGLGTGKLCSHVMVNEIPGFERLLLVTDGGLNILPDLNQKADIIKNAVALARALEIQTPRVALLASMEDVSPRLPATTDAASLTMMARNGVFGPAVVDGPLAIDNVFSPEAALIKGVKSEVAGHADIIIVPSVEVGNVLIKTIDFFSKTVSAGIVLGTRAPIILPSRAGSVESKWMSIALGVLLEGPQYP